VLCCDCSRRPAVRDREVWSWWNGRSTARLAVGDDLPQSDGGGLDAAAAAIGAIRKAKSGRAVAKAEVARLVVSGRQADLDIFP
jgi:hypothetical protein